MQVHTSPGSIHLIRPSISIGIFDGVHRGHQNLIARVREEAESSNAESLIITFWPHPRTVTGKADSEFRLLTTLEEKMEMLENCKVDHLLVVPFTADFARLSARQFLDDFLDRFIRPGAMVVGDDPRFGAGGSGNLELLRSYGRNHGFEVVQLDTHIENEERISSTLIRRRLLSGDLSSANHLLGYPYFITGRVVRGNRIGSAIGYPTANIECTEEFKQIPCDGVYAVTVEWKGGIYKGMLNIGTRPTITEDSRRSVEVHLFNEMADMYDETLRVRFMKRLRNELKFNNLDELKAQLALDKEASLKVLENIN
ncbi:MAG: bifunctional riboflavin kinase/FAD synthetase [Bacteroidales bacterium]|nr:bifunctional riboflavin kinase/FAD synthetase [Bacteroidales bacterium]